MTLPPFPWIARLTRLLALPVLLDAGALLAGGMYVLAFAPFAVAPLAPLALLLLFAVWQQTSPLRAAWRGYAFGLGAFGFGVSWVYVSIHDYGHADPLAASALTALFCGFWALFPAALGWVAVKLRCQTRLFGLPLLWVLMDYVRGEWLLNGFPWMLAGYSQLDGPLAGYIPVIGVYGVDFLLALSTSLALALLQPDRRRRWQGGLLLVIVAVGWVLCTVRWTHPSGSALQVAMVQGNIPQDEKWLPENQLKTLRLYRDLTRHHWGKDIIVWPETAIPAFLSEVEEFYLKPLEAEALAHQTDLIVSLPVEGAAAHELYNSVITLGRRHGQFSKNHLLPFGEYMPLQPLSGFLLRQLDLQLGDFTPGGDRQPLLWAGGYPFITSICYEDAFGEANRIGLPEAAYLVNVTNDGWFGQSIEPDQHLQIARMRALETGRYLLRATNTGVTALIAPDGKIAAQAPPFITTVLTAELTPMTGITPYAQLGDRPVMLVLLAAWGLLLLNRHRAVAKAGQGG